MLETFHSAVPLPPGSTLRTRAWGRLCGLVLQLALLAVCAAAGGVAQAQDAPALRDKFKSLQQPLANNPFGRPLVLESRENAGDLQGDIYAVVEHPFAQLAALARPEAWCEVLILHLNTKQCRTEGSSGVVVNVGKKYDQPIEQTSRIAFDWKLAAQTPEFLQVRLNAPEGPLGTRDYRIVLEAVPIEGSERRSFLHLAYSYGYGFAARVALKGYLATAGADKVGFSVTGKDADGKPQYVGGVRGVVERNTMRYYLAIDAYLDSLDAPPAEQQKKRLEAWFDATERYATQLHEMPRDEYLAMKKREVSRQQAEPR